MESVFSKAISLTALALFATIPAVSAHTWADQITRIAPNGTFVGTPGYPRGFYPRVAGANLTANVWQVQGIPDSFNICSDKQQPGAPAPYPGFPQLTASAGDFVAIRYAENGHVTEPKQAATPTSTKGFGSGLVYIYGTENPQVDDKYNAIHKVWNKDGTGGDKRGKLLAVQYFDDMECYLDGNENASGDNKLEIQGMTLAQMRAKAYPHNETAISGKSLLCQTDFQIPADVKVNSNYSIYWVWDWPTLDLQGKVVTNQSYTICADIAIQASSSPQPVNYVAPQDYNYNAQWSQMVNPFVADPTASQKIYSTRSTTDLFATPTVFASSGAQATGTGGYTASVIANGTANGYVAPTAPGGSSSSRQMSTSTTTLTQSGASATGGSAAAGSTGYVYKSGPPVVQPFIARSPRIRGRGIY
ncbi:hypothetical protein CJF31_00008600 [Rutstroemia sp. NJR-2017a BVV2]|nr:hypothetical protein CJF31_00008600 [Rutstroemia sp. NJR-2017a BVV2]